MERIPLRLKPSAGAGLALVEPGLLPSLAGRGACSLALGEAPGVGDPGLLGASRRWARGALAMSQGAGIKARRGGG